MCYIYLFFTFTYIIYILLGLFISLYFSPLLLFAHKHKHAKTNTHVKLRPGRKSSGAQREGYSQSGSMKLLGLKLQEPDSPTTAPRAESPRSRSIFLYMSEFGETQTKSGGTREGTSLFLLFSYAQNCFLFPTFFFHLRRKGVLILITWLQFTWDKTKGAKKRGERRTERGRIKQRDALMVGILLSQLTFRDNEKNVNFGLEASVSHGEDTRGHCCEEKRLCLYQCGL